MMRRDEFSLSDLTTDFADGTDKYIVLSASIRLSAKSAVSKNFWGAQCCQHCMRDHSCLIRVIRAIRGQKHFLRGAKKRTIGAPIATIVELHAEKAFSSKSRSPNIF